VEVDLLPVGADLLLRLLLLAGADLLLRLLLEVDVLLRLLLLLQGVEVEAAVVARGHLQALLLPAVRQLLR
jgi:hypothetical protein